MRLGDPEALGHAVNSEENLSAVMQSLLFWWHWSPSAWPVFGASEHWPPAQSPADQYHQSLPVSDPAGDHFVSGLAHGSPAT